MLNRSNSQDENLEYAQISDVISYEYLFLKLLPFILLKKKYFNTHTKVFLECTYGKVLHTLLETHIFLIQNGELLILRIILQEKT